MADYIITDGDVRKITDAIHNSVTDQNRNIAFKPGVVWPDTINPGDDIARYIDALQGNGGGGGTKPKNTVTLTMVGVKMDGATIENPTEVVVISLNDYKALESKQANTIYFIYQDSEA